MVREALFGRYEDEIDGVRIRSRDISRLEGMTDASLGFAITLLIVSQEVPRSYDDLVQMLFGFPAFAVTFLLVMFIWYWHNVFFRSYALVTRKTTFISCLLMFLVLMFVFPLKFMATGVITGLLMGNVIGLPVDLSDYQLGATEVGMLHVIFASGFCAVYLCMAWLHSAALEARETLELSDKEVLHTQTARTSFVIVALVGLSTILPALVLPDGINAMVAGFSMMLVWPAQLSYGRWMGRRIKRLEEDADGTAATA